MAKKDTTRAASATERVEDYIRQAIYRGTLKPRERVIEEDLANELNCSRGPVREALLRLERDGLIASVARRGTFVQDISPESIEVIFSMRGKLEALCVRYLREQSTDETRRAVSDALKKMKVAASKKDDEEFFEADMNLHQTIWKLSKRETLQRHLNTIMNPFIFILARAYSNQTPIQTRYKEHAEYVEMIFATPIGRVEQLVEQYFKNLGTQILSRINSPFFTTGIGDRPNASRL
jgi:DNA-binding GntR family transcriptional regulator